MARRYWQQSGNSFRVTLGWRCHLEKGNPWLPFNRVIAHGASSFRYRGLQHFVTIGEVDETKAQGVKARYEYLLRLLKQRLLTLPTGMDVVTFLGHDGKPPKCARRIRPPRVHLGPTFRRLSEDRRQRGYREEYSVHLENPSCPHGRNTWPAVCDHESRPRRSTAPRH